MRAMSRVKTKVLGVAMAAVLAASPLMLVSMSTLTGCGGGKVCLPDVCGCNGFFGIGLLAIFLLKGGQAGDGISCWDLNSNGACDLATEDANSDGICSALDCQGPPGEPAQPIPGVDGLSCWDTNGNGVCDPATEDVTGDGLCDALDCRGPAGPPGKDGTDGTDGADGKDGTPALFDQFIEDFFTYAPWAISDNVSGQTEVINIQEPMLGFQAESLGPIGFRISVPEIYTQGYPVTLRLFLWRDATDGFCTTLQLDTFRMIPDGGIERYGNTVWLRLEPGNMTDPGMLVVDLPLNTPAPTGLGFPNDLYAPQMLAWELRVFSPTVTTFSGADLDAELTILGAELFESASAADTAISGVTVFTSDSGVVTFCEVGTQIPD
jgi:hypothetical protein